MEHQGVPTFESLDYRSNEGIFSNVGDGQVLTSDSFGIEPREIEFDFKRTDEALKDAEVDFSEEVLERAVEEFRTRNAFPEGAEVKPPNEDELKLAVASGLVLRSVSRLLRFDFSEGQKEYVDSVESGVKKLKLSELITEKPVVACFEISSISYYLLKKMGIDAQIVVGGIVQDQEDIENSFALIGPHVYLVIDGGKYIFDPAHSLQLGWPAIFVPQKSLNRENLLLDNDGLIECRPLSPKRERNVLYGHGGGLLSSIREGESNLPPDEMKIKYGVIK